MTEKSEPGAALPAEHAPPVATNLIGAPLKWVVKKSELDGSQGWYVLLPETGRYWFAPEREADAQKFCEKLNGGSRPALAGSPEQIIEIDEDGKVHGDTRGVVRDPEGTYE